MRSAHRDGLIIFYERLAHVLHTELTSACILFSRHFVFQLLHPCHDQDLYPPEPRAPFTKRRGTDPVRAAECRRGRLRLRFFQHRDDLVVKRTKKFNFWLPLLFGRNAISMTM